MPTVKCIHCGEIFHYSVANDKSFFRYIQKAFPWWDRKSISPIICIFCEEKFFEIAEKSLDTPADSGILDLDREP